MASESSIRLLQFARRILKDEAALSPRPAKGVVGFSAYERLRHTLCRTFGTGGCQSLMNRTLTIVGAKIAWLRELKVRSDGALEGWAELTQAQGTLAQEEAEAVLLTELLGLLTTFLGPAITLSLVQEAWPTLGDVDL